MFNHGKSVVAQFSILSLRPMSLLIPRRLLLTPEHSINAGPHSFSSQAKQSFRDPSRLLFGSRNNLYFRQGIRQFWMEHWISFNQQSMDRGDGERVRMEEMIHRSVSNEHNYSTCALPTESNLGVHTSMSCFPASPKSFHSTTVAGRCQVMSHGNILQRNLWVIDRTIYMCVHIFG